MLRTSYPKGINIRVLRKVRTKWIKNKTFFLIRNFLVKSSYKTDVTKNHQSEEFYLQETESIGENRANLPKKPSIFEKIDQICPRNRVSRRKSEEIAQETEYLGENRAKLPKKLKI